MMSKAILDRLEANGVLPVLTLEDAADAPPLAEALWTGGLSCAEVTFRSPAAVACLKALRAARPDLLLGAGTVLTPDQVVQAVDAGAAFLVTPGLNPRVVEAAQAQGIPVFPGVISPSEIERGMELGLDTFKFFPAEVAGGLPFLRALAGPYRRVRFIPTGGIHAGNLAAYLAEPTVVACGGTWLATPEQLQAGDFDGIRRRVEGAVGIVRAARSRA